ncbi:helix-turn-helix transcriptional regulator [Paenibacillus glycanilyticus]|uniref:helix-turn-helix domain-containing protein n=1 Tax=Paenibacillus glycanilyticus TaxID=126569 RepID=UPI00203AF425|nr:helix-turn-helix transcriptional regulator [Paenibacillus glycanilyticus]MCM3628785.1 helix-turn-helix transcriptional regulator [Paenibacillus glycanilyticus]
MGFSYKPLFKLLVEKEMTKEELREAIGASSSTIAKMSKGENVSMEVLNKICALFNCKIEDVIEYIK